MIDADAFSAEMRKRQDAVKEWMSKGKDEETCARAGSAYVMLAEVKLLLDQTPTIDAVEVVRCRECKHLFDGEHDANCCAVLMEKAKWVQEITVDDDWFCADGEVKE